MPDKGPGEAPPEPQKAVITLVRAGAEVADAATTAGVSEAVLKEWLDDRSFVSRVEQAQAHARTLIDTGQRKQRAGEWERRRVGGNKGPKEVSMPGAPIKCQAVTSGGKRPCKNWANVGSNVCRFHGGNAPQVKAAAARRLGVSTIGDLMTRLGHASEPDPLEALMTELHRTSVMVEIFQFQVSALPVEELDADPTLLFDRLSIERDRKARMAKMAIDAGLTERVVRVQEAQAALLAQVIQAIVLDEELGLDRAQQEIARRVAARHLRALPAASSG